MGVGLQEYSNMLWGGDNVGHVVHSGGTVYGVTFTLMCCVQGDWGDRRSRLVGGRGRVIKFQLVTITPHKEIVERMHRRTYC